jgi:hypothetical protein
LNHAAVKFLHLLLLLLIGNFKTLGFGKLRLVGDAAIFDLLSIAQVSLGCRTLICGVVLWVLLRRVLHVASLVVELGLLLHEALRIHLRVHVRVVHVVLGLLRLLLVGWAARLLAFNYELEHFELVVLHSPHMLHLLMVHALGLLEHATVAAG